MISPPQLAAVVLLAVGVFVVAILVSGGEVSPSWSAHVGATITSVAVVIAAFNLWLWRLDFLQSWFVKRPHLWGIWNVTIITQWADPASGERQEPVKATFVIRQTYTALHIRMTSDQSSGHLLSVNLFEREDGGVRLAGIYQNDPKLAERNALAIHYGAFVLDIEGLANSPTRMTGSYWTDRDTKGEIVADKRRVK